MAACKSLDQHIEYLQEIVKLGLWMTADWKNKHPKEHFVDIIHERTCLVNHTVFNPGSLFDAPNFEGEEWPKIRLQLKSLYEENNNPEWFEKDGYDLLKNHLAGRAKKDLENLNSGEIFSQHHNRWIRYDVNKRDDPEGYIEIHMANTHYPSSFLADKDYFNKQLIEALLDIEKHNFKGLRTKSWINDHPPWQSLMPKEWSESIYDRDYNVEWHLGFWGQFLTANQCFNKKLGKQYREAGQIIYPMSKARASLASFKSFLDI